MAGRGSGPRPTSGPCTITRASSASRPLGRGEQGVDVDLLDPGLLDDQLAEPHQELLQGREVDRLAAADALQGRVDPGLLHHPPGQGRVQRRQGQRAVLEDLDELAARAEEQDRAELRVEAAADDQLVAVAAGPSAGRSRPGSARRRRARAPTPRSRDRRGGPRRRRPG